MDVQRPPKHQEVRRFYVPPGTRVEAMADSQRDSAPSCGATCTNFSSTQKGVLLFAEIIFCLVILVCFSTSEPRYSSLSVVEVILAVFFFVLYGSNLHTRITFINWPWCDFFRSFIAAILYLITSTVVLVERVNLSTIIAGVLGLIATFLFSYDAYVTVPLSK